MAALAALAIHASPVEARPGVLELPYCAEKDLKQSKTGISWCDVKKGSGEGAQVGDNILIRFTARANGSTYDGSLMEKDYNIEIGDPVLPQPEGWILGIVGTDDVPAVTPGTIRSVRIPPELGYGKRGLGCLYNRPGSCRVPPDATLDINFEFRDFAY